jgi:hypothetical protein
MDLTSFDDRDQNESGTGVFYVHGHSERLGPFLETVGRVSLQSEPAFLDPFAPRRNDHAWHWTTPLETTDRGPLALQKHFLHPLDYALCRQIGEYAIAYFFVPDSAERFDELAATICPSDSCDPAVPDSCYRRGCRCQSDRTCK